MVYAFEVVGAADFARLRVCPPHEVVFFVAEQVARGLAVADHQRDVVLAGFGIKGGKVGIVEDIDVVDEDGAVAGVEKGQCLTESAAGVEECGAFVGDGDAGVIGVGGEVFDDFLAEVVYVDDYFCGSGLLQPVDGEVEQCVSRNRDEGFGESVGERFKACAESGGKDEGFHGW